MKVKIMQVMAACLSLLFSPSLAKAQFTITTNDGAITIAKYIGGGDVIVPSMTNGWPVKSIGNSAFIFLPSLTSVTIPASVESIGNNCFENSTNLSSVILTNGLKSMGQAAFHLCSSLTNITLPNSVTNIGQGAFDSCRKLTEIKIPTGLGTIQRFTFVNCSGLTNVTITTNVVSIQDGAFELCNLSAISIPASVTNLGAYAFYACTNLTAVYFQGDAPTADATVFSGGNPTMVYYLPGTSGWTPQFGGVSALLWNPLMQSQGGSFGVKTGQFGFDIAGTADIPIVIEACTDATSGNWTPQQACFLTNGSIHFTDLSWTNYPGRIYRVRSP